VQKTDHKNECSKQELIRNSEEYVNPNARGHQPGNENSQLEKFELGRKLRKNKQYSPWKFVDETWKLWNWSVQPFWRRNARSL
jgi:hypothetical protein